MTKDDKKLKIEKLANDGGDGRDKNQIFIYFA
jgi:hypothetical protein